jgi:GAF domain-containing protein
VDRLGDPHQVASLAVARSPLAWAILALALTDAVLIGGLGWVLFRKGDANWAGGFGVQGEGPDAPVVVSVVEEGGPVQDRLRPGDRILAIDGERRVTPTTLLLLSRALAAGPRLEIEREGEVLQVQLAPLRVRWPEQRWHAVFYAPASVALLVVGAGVGILRPRQREAVLFALAALAAAPPILVRSGATAAQRAGALEPWEDWLVTASHLPSPLHLVLALAFVFAFPARPALGRGWVALRVAVSGIGLLVWCGSASADIAGAVQSRLDVVAAWEHPALWRAARRAIELYPGLAFGLMIAVVVAKYRGTAALSDRSRMSWLVTSIVVGILPSALYYALRAGLVLTGRETEGIHWLSDLGALTLTAVPLGVGYALVRHQIFDIRVVVRRGLGYLLARGSLQAAALVPALLIGIEISRDPAQPVGHLVSRRPAVWVALVGSLLLLFARPRIVAWLDRRFFRAPYEPEMVLLSLLQEIGSQDTVEDLARATAARIQAALHPQSVQVFLREANTGDLVRRYASDGVTGTATMGPSSSAVRIAERDGRPVLLPPEVEGARAVEPQPAVVAVPIGGGERPLSGLLLLGAKLSEEPYSTKDLQLLETIAGQLAIANENATLRRQVDEGQRVRQEVLARLDGRGINLVQECPVCGSCFDRGERSCERHGPVLTLSLPVERTVDARWRLERRLGRGGMGTVYEATDLRLGRRVALKFMHATTLGDDGARRRFEREARALARLQHPHLVSLFDFGNAGAAGAYLVMELVTGPSLRDELRGNTPLAPAAIADWFDQILDAVAFAHRNGVIHRDLKPENIVLTGERGAWDAKVLDFGVARFRLPGQAESIELTETGAIVGTLAYMAPEQVLGLRVDERADVFALGVILVETLTGRHPFRRVDADRTIAAILGEPVTLGGEDGPPADLEAILRDTLAKERDRRLGSVEELRARVVPALRSSPLLRVVARLDAVADARTATSPARMKGPTPGS